jgi:MFS family permease
VSAGAPEALSSQPARLRFGLLVVCLGSLIGPLDTSVNVAFPLITKRFGLAISDIQWVVASYIIVQSGLTLAFGQLGDLYGYRRIFRLGMAGCAITHLLCSLAPTYPLLIAARIAQGITVGLAMACGPALATLLFPPQFRRPILALYVMVLGAGIALGPLVAGLLLDRFGWPSVFWYRAPWCAIVLLLTLWLPEPTQEKHAKPQFDFMGALLLVASLASLILLLSMARRPDASVLSVLLFAALLVACTWGFVRHETHFVQPILHIRYLSDPKFGGLQLASVVINLCGFSIFLLLPYVLDAHLRVSSMGIGAVLALSPIGAVFAGFAGGWFARQWPAQRLLAWGMLLCAAGLGLLAWFIALNGLVLVGVALLMTGLGIGLFQVGYMDLTTATLPPAQRGVAGSLLNVTRVVGAVIGAATITWMLDLWQVAHPGLAAFQLSFGCLAAALCLFVMAFKRTNG